MAGEVFSLEGDLLLGNLRALKKVQSCSRSRKTKILTAGIHPVF
jgi:hypothetical protein